MKIEIIRKNEIEEYKEWEEERRKEMKGGRKDKCY